MPPSTTGATAQGAYITKAYPKDPYQYQVGFGNRFASEALPDVLPQGQNSPQKNKYGLYNEGMTGSPFVAPRHENMQAWLYRIRPSVAHQGFTRLPDNPDMESSFLSLNPKVHVSPTQLAWYPFKLPPDSEKVDFVEGLKTLAGGGDSTLREGLAIHMYLANASMDKKAFCNGDGDMLILPQQGRLDIQTEFGKMMVRPGELCVIQRGMNFKVILPDGPSRGCGCTSFSGTLLPSLRVITPPSPDIQEVFGTHYTLPDLGPVGGNGLADPRDFETPIACFEIDQSSWEVVYKVAGQLHACHQEHTPFDVVAWHGNYVPYKYDMDKFIYVGSISRDHIDPSIFCILTAKSKQTGIPLADFLAVGERWDVASNTFRPPASLISGSFPGRSDGFAPGGASLETGFCPHGVDYDVWNAATHMELVAEKVFQGTLVIVFESSMPLTITDYAMNRSSVKHEHEPKMWDNLKANFMNHLDEANADLKAAGLPQLGSTQ
ncbi:hypothetical protein D9756_009226 [Leucocoprinus leucothites]|uniref:homogentisate 1,2-dioxygenase n=1 Tax=Leucocoprinus leucothites TaxID=201217 RepID=A0A8H5CZJ0_9AGAR|nr:hypothetical protein D9756_009226 [Leucoagaricus leucothites]